MKTRTDFVYVCMRLQGRQPMAPQPSRRTSRDSNTEPGDQHVQRRTHSKYAGSATQQQQQPVAHAPGGTRTDASHGRGMDQRLGSGATSHVLDPPLRQVVVLAAGAADGLEPVPVKFCHASGSGCADVLGMEHNGRALWKTR